MVADPAKEDKATAPGRSRVEQAWRRTAALNRLRAGRPELTRPIAETAADVASIIGVSVADAHLAVNFTNTPGPHTVPTSDEDDVRRGADHAGVPVTMVTV